MNEGKIDDDPQNKEFTPNEMRKQNERSFKTHTNT